MSSFIASARRSGISIADTVTKSTNMLGDAVDIAANGLDALAIKTRVMHREVSILAEYDIASAEIRIEQEVAARDAEREQELTRRLEALGVSEADFRNKIEELRKLRKPLNAPKHSVAAD